jgi:hypothetical protein
MNNDAMSEERRLVIRLFLDQIEDDPRATQWFDSRLVLRARAAIAPASPPAADPRVAEAVKDDANVLALIEGIVKRFGWRPFETENLDVWLPRQLQMAQAYQARTPNGRTLAEAVTETQTILDKIIDDYDPDDASADGMITRVVKAAEALADRP